MKKYLKCIIGSIIIIVIGTFIFSILHYFDIMSTLTVNIFKLITIIIFPLYNGFIMGKNTKRLGYISGLKCGIVIDIILIIYNLIFNRIFTLKTIIFYLIILSISIIGGMIGISRNKKE